MKWLFALLLTCSTAAAQVAGVAMYLQYAPPGAPPPPPLTPPVPVTNFVPNSSFELGAARGWITYGSGGHTSYGNISSVQGNINTNSGAHGSNSLLLLMWALSRPMYLTSATYTVTFYTKADSPTTARWTNVLDNYQIQPGIPISVGTSWTRYTNTWACLSNGYYAIKFVSGAEDRLIYIDGVQIQVGPTATAYTPSLPVEAGLGTADINDILLAGDTKQFQLRWWNDTGTNTTAFATYSLHDMWNSNFLTATFSTNALVPGPTTVNVLLPTDRLGWMRVMLHQPTVNESWDEKILAVFPYAASTTVNTNGVLGSHPEWGVYGVKRDRRLGYTASRDLSPAQGMRWQSVQPTPFGAFVWSGGGINNSDYEAASFSTNGTMPLLVLTPIKSNDPDWPQWATNSDGSASITLWSNYCWAVVNRFSVAPSNCFIYEIGNEWHNIITPTDFLGGVFPATSYFLAASNRARFIVAGAQAVKAACPNCTVVGIAGENSASRAMTTWTNMTAGEQALINVISAHLYPLNQGGDNPNAVNEDDIGLVRSSLAWKVLFGAIRPLWNTEMGGQGAGGGFLGPSSLAKWSFMPFGFLFPEAGRDWRLGHRKVVSVDREDRQVIRCLGNGFKKVFHYTSKAFQEVNLNHTEGFLPGNMETTGAPKVANVATLIAANHFIRNPGLGRLTNTASAFVEAYFFTNELSTVVSLWTTDWLERTLTTGDGRFGVFDCMGNLVQTNSVSFRIGRTPVFVVSGSLTTAQLSNAIMVAAVTNVVDVTGPNISIDVSPIGMIPVGQTNLFKWTATDRNKQPWGINDWPADRSDTNIMSRIKFAAADSWIDVGQSNHFYKAFTVAGATNRIFVESKDFYNNRTTNQGPEVVSF